MKKIAMMGVLSCLVVGILLVSAVPMVVCAPLAYDKNTILCDHDFAFTNSLSEAEIQDIFDSHNSFFKDYIDPVTSQRASWVIADRAQHYQISSRVLLAKMQAESSSVWAYRDMDEHIPNKAGIDMGTRAEWVLFYGWSDTTIYPQYKGFYNQVDNAAKSLSEWFSNPSSKGWTVGQPHLVSDGTVTPTNQATAALYIYTPWISSNELLYNVWKMMFGDTGECSVIAYSFRLPLEGDWTPLTQDFANWYKCGYHLAEDVTRDSEVPVYATADGIVKLANLKGDGYGYVVIIQHKLPPDDPDGDYVCTLYGHLRKEGLIASGVSVSKGDVIGNLSSKPEYNWGVIHLHFGIREGPYLGEINDPRTGHWYYAGYTKIHDQCDKYDSKHQQILAEWFNPTTDLINGEGFIERHQAIPPIPSFIFTPQNPIVDEEVTFDASASYDPDGGDITNYNWEFYRLTPYVPYPLIGVGEDKSVIKFSFLSEGDYFVRLTVTDDEGQTNLAEKSIRTPTIDIIKPTKDSPAIAGYYKNPSHIEVKVKFETTEPIKLTNADFSFKIGDIVTPSSLVDTSIAGEYVFDVTPPKQSSSGKYNLEVSTIFRGFTFKDVEEEAVKYTAENADVILIIDRSGSMNWPSSKITDAKTSAKLFIDYMRDGDKAGVVSFSSSASYNYYLNTLTDAVKTSIKSAIDWISAWGGTAMGRGLRYGYNDFINRGDPTHAWAMVLLSDGYHNTGEHPNNVLPSIKSQDIVVYTIGLGPSVDKNLLEYIATETGGKYYYTPTSDQLNEIYESIVGKVIGWQTILKRYLTILSNQIIHINVPIDPSVSEATFSISWSGSDLDLILYKPDETMIDPGVAATDPNIDYVEEATYEFYRVRKLDSGDWKMEIIAVSVPPGGEEFTATVTGTSALSMSLSTDKDQYNQGEAVKTTVSLTEDGSPIVGANVMADISLHDNSIESFILYDDGGHGDGAANDGVYANYFVNTLQIGDYEVEATATGTTLTGNPFSRESDTSFKIIQGPSRITFTPDTWDETANAGEQVKNAFTVVDPSEVGEQFPVNEYLYAEYNGTHYLVYNESSIGGEPDYIISSNPGSNPQVSKWVSLTATSLQTLTGDIIDASNVIISPNVLEVPLGGYEDFDVTINIPSDAVGGIYTGKIVASAITGSDSIDITLTVEEAVDTTPPTIESVTLDAYTTIPDATIHVTVAATDNVGVSSVTADGVALVETGSTWEGDITAPSATGDYSLTIRAEDAEENFAETTEGYLVVIPTGGLGVAILPKISSIPAGSTLPLDIKIVSTENFDDVLHVYLTLDGIPPDYQADFSWFDWTDTTVHVPIGQEIVLPIAVDIPGGTSPGYKSFGVKVESTKWSSNAQDYGAISVA